MKASNVNTVRRSGYDFHSLLTFELERILRRDNVTKDPFFANTFVVYGHGTTFNIDALTRYPTLAPLNICSDDIVQACAKSNRLSVDYENGTVRPDLIPRRTTIILRDLPHDVHVDELLSLFAICPFLDFSTTMLGPSPPVDTSQQPSDSERRTSIGTASTASTPTAKHVGRIFEITEYRGLWFVTVNHEETAKKVTRWLQRQLFRGEAVKARIRSVNTRTCLPTQGLYMTECNELQPFSLSQSYGSQYGLSVGCQSLPQNDHCDSHCNCGWIDTTQRMTLSRAPTSASSATGPSYSSFTHLPHTLGQLTSNVATMVTTRPQTTHCSSDSTDHAPHAGRPYTTVISTNGHSYPNATFENIFLSSEPEPAPFKWHTPSSYSSQAVIGGTVSNCTSAPKTSFPGASPYSANIEPSDYCGRGKPFIEQEGNYYAASPSNAPNGPLVCYCYTCSHPECHTASIVDYSPAHPVDVTARFPYPAHSSIPNDQCHHLYLLNQPNHGDAAAQDQGSVRTLRPLPGDCGSQKSPNRQYSPSNHYAPTTTANHATVAARYPPSGREFRGPRRFPVRRMRRPDAPPRPFHQKTSTNFTDRHRCCEVLAVAAYDQCQFPSLDEAAINRRLKPKPSRNSQSRYQNAKATDFHRPHVRKDVERSTND